MSDGPILFEGRADCGCEVSAVHRGGAVALTCEAHRGQMAVFMVSRGLRERVERALREGEGDAIMSNPLARPLVFGDPEQIAAVKALPREGALHVYVFGFDYQARGIVRVVAVDEATARTLARVALFEEDFAQSHLDTRAELVGPATDDDTEGDVECEGEL